MSRREMESTVVRILDSLQGNRIRATYGAVGQVIGRQARSVGSVLGERCPKAAWVVRRDTGQPTGYAEHQKHAELCIRCEIISDGEELIRRMRQAAGPRG